MNEKYMKKKYQTSNTKLFFVFTKRRREFQPILLNQCYSLGMLITIYAAIVTSSQMDYQIILEDKRLLIGEYKRYFVKHIL
ncbi:hypothetical protein RhiirA1_481967 [Rhizophagus irregularis]|uniref:Uncharacterized protein n=1 Tax=Rhizophagus irregularis TaxID=588596 RepID=A0A2N0QMG8_9GLOM|nr:hypothetical protein RhiirA1_481967 [Rhizophagus irregularis]